MTQLSQYWSRRRRQAQVRTALWFGAPVFVAVAWLDWAAFWALIRAAAAPAGPLTWFALVPAACAAAVAVHYGLRRLSRAPADRATLQVLDLVRRGRGDLQEIDRFWQGREQAARLDAWAYAMFWSILAVLMLNTWGAWGPLARAMFSREEIRITTFVDDPLVEITELRIVSPVTTVVRELHESDGFLQVDEGATVSWVIEPLRAADAVELELPAVTLRDLSTGPYLFSTDISRPTRYRFAIRKYNVRFVESHARRIDVRPDLPPEVDWIVPPPPLLDEQRQIDVVMRTRDDRAVTGVALTVRTDDGERLVFDAPLEATMARFLIDPAELPPAESWQFIGLAWDNDRWDGPNVGRSDTVTVRRRSVEQEHEAWTESLLSWLRRQVQYLGPLVDHAQRPRWWDSEEAWLRQQAAGLAETGRALEEIVETLPLRSIDAVDTVVRIARTYERLFDTGRTPDQVIADVEQAVFDTDELIGLEQAARTEYQQQQVYSRLESMSRRISDATDQELTRMLEALQREMEQLAKDMRDKRPQLPTELLQKDAFRAEKRSEQADLMQQIRDAIARGDRERAKELMQQLLDLMRKAREEAASAASSRAAGSDRGGAAMERASQELSRLAEAQRKLSKQLQQAENAMRERAQQLLQKASPSGANSARRQQARRRLQQALERGDHQAVEDALTEMGKADDDVVRKELRGYRQAAEAARKLVQQQASLRQQTGQVALQLQEEAGGPPQVLDELEQAQHEMRAVEDASGSGRLAEARQRSWQALGHLERASEQLAEKQEQRRRLAERPSFSDPLARDDETEEHRGDESFDTPESGTDPRSVREQVLESFRRGVDGPVREINERYLDRLLH